MLPELAVKVVDCVVLTAETAAENPTLVALTGMVTEAGTVTAVLLLERFTISPLPVAGPLSVAVQASVPEPVIVDAIQETALSVAWLTFNSKANDLETPPSVAVRVAV
jgi:hypothetical protein